MLPRDAGHPRLGPSHVVKTSMNLYCGVRTVGIDDGLACLSRQLVGPIKENLLGSPKEFNSLVVPAVAVCIAAQAASRLS